MLLDGDSYTNDSAFYGIFNERADTVSPPNIAASSPSAFQGVQLLRLP